MNRNDGRFQMEPYASASPRGAEQLRPPRAGRFSVKVVLSLLTVLLCSPPSCSSQDVVELLTTEYEPFCGLKGDTMWCDLVNSAFGREGFRVQWRSYPQDREEAMVAEGVSIAFLSGTLVVTPDERPSFIINAEPMIYASIVAFYPKDRYPRGLGLKSAGDLKGKRVGVLQGTGSVNVLEKAGVDLDATPSKDLLMKKLVAGRDDVAVIADLAGLKALKESFPDLVDAYGYELVYNSPIDLIFSKKNPRSVDLLNRFNAGIAKIKADGTFMKILERYYPKGRINKGILPKDLR
jgi:polar amino acid transport system substrate-binding protein